MQYGIVPKFVILYLTTKYKQLYIYTYKRFCLVRGFHVSPLMWVKEKTYIVSKVNIQMLTFPSFLLRVTWGLNFFWSAQLRVIVSPLSNNYKKILGPHLSVFLLIYVDVCKIFFNLIYTSIYIYFVYWMLLIFIDLC